MLKKTIIIIITVIVISISSAYLILDYTFTAQQNYQVQNDPYVKNCVPAESDKVVLFTILIENKTHTFDLRQCVWNEKIHYESEDLFTNDNRYEITGETVLSSNGQEHRIHYEIKNGDVSDMWYSKDANSLNLKLDTSSDGEMLLTIPQELFNSPKVNQGERFMILYDGKEIFSLNNSDKMNHIMHFNFTHPNPTIEVIGAFIP